MDSNAEPEKLAGAKADSFNIIYNGNDTHVIQSGGNYYCNATRLPKSFDPDSAHFDNLFLLTSEKSWVKCKEMGFLVNQKTFKPLKYPYFTDGRVIFTAEGSIVKEADAKTFVSLSNHQARDKANYYFSAMNDVTIPWHKSVQACTASYGWAKIDGKWYFEGKKKTEVEPNTFRCLSFPLAVDNNGFYTSGKRSYLFTKQIKTASLHFLSENVLTDGHNIWFSRAGIMKLEGLEPKTLSVSGLGNITVTDGKVSWYCPSTNQIGQPLCHRSEEEQ
ncbi:DKNYY domain-containing protein [Enterobacter ludwigii]|uniref:DKNYY domain-containing protein n=1 Tax=Enterobacter ludwigii TaxID=299767 RepID=UPI001E42B555|nr:DKNYY domain-containing protein [Enterobacter ludwigii]MCE1608879.1 DKNYY domain-containing protein [Enterobacter ludwigii]MCE1622175.1 DKNYY domain-containing protein [Enterobacter ludwigii]